MTILSLEGLLWVVGVVVLCLAVQYPYLRRQEESARLAIERDEMLKRIGRLEALITDREEN